MKEIVRINLPHIIKFKLSFILYENNADTFNRKKLRCYSVGNTDLIESRE